METAVLLPEVRHGAASPGRRNLVGRRDGSARQLLRLERGDPCSPAGGTNRALPFTLLEAVEREFWPALRRDVARLACQRYQSIRSLCRHRSEEHTSEL